MARSYRRDARGRFAGGGGSGRVTGGSLKARTSARRSRAKLAAKDAGGNSLSATLSRRAQRAAVTRTGKAATAARAASRTKLGGGKPSGTVGKRKKADATRGSAKSQFSKVQLTKADIVNRITRGSANERQRSNLAAIAKGSQRRMSNYVEVTRRRNSFFESIGASARSLKKATPGTGPAPGRAGDKEWAKAFKARPRYTTRQKVKPSFPVRTRLSDPLR